MELLFIYFLFKPVEHVILIVHKYPAYPRECMTCHKPNLFAIKSIVLVQVAVTRVV